MNPPPSDIDFEAVLRNTQARIRAYIAGMGIATHEVDDVAQEVYLEFYKGLDKIPPQVAPQRWLKGIARNVCLNYIRRTARKGRLHREAIAELLAQTETKVHKLATDGELTDRLEDCCRQLPEKSRRLLELKYRDDLSSQAMAETLGSTAQAVRVALHRLRNALKDCVTSTASAGPGLPRSGSGMIANGGGS